MLRRAVLSVAMLAVSACAGDTVRSAASSTSISPSTTTSTTTTTTTTTTSTTTTSTTTTSTTLPTTTTTTTASTSTTAPTSTTTTTTTAPTTSTTDVRGSIWEVRPPSDIPPPPVPADWSSERIGTSIAGRAITALRRASAAPRRTVLVVGGIHGNEPASPPIVRSLVEIALPPDFEVWLVPEMNPDGVAAGTRDNAAGVDLNRNFPWEWRPIDGGPAPLSEPETQAITGLIDRLRPDLVVWVHQPLGYVSSIGATSDTYEQAWSRGAAIPIRPDVTQHGGGESWAALGAGRGALLVEVPGREATPEIVAAQRAGYAELIAELG